MDIRIDRLQRRAAESSGVLSLAGGLPLSSLFPIEDLLASHQSMSPEAQAQALQYTWPEGSEKLRAWVADRLVESGAMVHAEDVVITTGAQQALSLVARDADLQTSSLTQALVEQVLSDIDWGSHLAKARSIYAGRMGRLMDAVTHYLPKFDFIEPEGGFSLFVVSDDIALDEMALLDLCTRAGTSFDPGSMFRPNMASTPFAMRLCPCIVPEEKIGEAVRRLATTIISFQSRLAPAASTA